MKRRFVCTLMAMSMMVLVGSCVPSRTFTSYPLGHDLYLENGRNQRHLEHQEVVQLIEDVLSTHETEVPYPEVTLIHPYDHAVFPPEIASPTFVWRDGNPASQHWLITISFKNHLRSIHVWSDETQWTPESRDLWDGIKGTMRGEEAEITILGVGGEDGSTITSRSRVAISIASEEVGAPIFFQQVPLPFAHASAHPHLFKWRMGDIASYEDPHVVMKGLPTCGFCHSFSQDGKTLGMDIDYGNDKGAYLLTPVRKIALLTEADFISWNRIRLSEDVPNMGLFSRVSPDGRYVVSTVNDKPMMAILNHLDFSQFFFPITGSLAFYSREEKRFHLLPGADDPGYVQTSPEWSPDGKTLVFARARMNPELLEVMENRRVLETEPDVDIHGLNQRYRIQFDLYRVPFNEGRGGPPEPIPGASHNGMSNYFPRYSPDGKWIVFTQSETGLVLQPSSQLFIVPADGGPPRKMRCNRALHNSWHSWSPNGRWIVFTSKVNTPYTELFLSHVDENGNDTPPVLLSRFKSKYYAAVIPEFVNIRPDAIWEMDLIED